jgi:hypothetical protein
MNIRVMPVTSPAASTPGYHFYRIDQQGHSWGAPEIADCRSDAGAIAHAKQILTGYVIEVRQGLRTVMRVEPEILPPGRCLKRVTSPAHQRPPQRARTVSWFPAL